VCRLGQGRASAFCSADKAKGPTGGLAFAAKGPNADQFNGERNWPWVVFVMEAQLGYTFLQFAASFTTSYTSTPLLGPK
jgi:hypothetical protein